ncbi:MAG: hypothetical protein HRT61_12460 [Ekhidna sp.]|nr:hypothetical protein [Ekhidna sp.]
MLFSIASGCAFVENRQREVKLSASVPEIEKSREVKILTVFFGLDNALPRQARIFYKDGFGKDGMPVVFSHEIEPSSLDASDFSITTKSGEVYPVEAVTLLPAEEEFELRTVLLIGDYGNHPENPPLQLEIVDDLMTRTGVNYKGQSQKVIPLEQGPILSYAEYFTFDETYPYIESGIGCDCPKESTKMIVKAVWAGGVRAVNGDELGANELNAFQVTLVQGADTVTVTPYQLADLSDGDNNTDLCLSESGIPVKLEVKENTAIDPRNDKNPRTAIEIVSRW